MVLTRLGRTSQAKEEYASVRIDGSEDRNKGDHDGHDHENDNARNDTTAERLIATHQLAHRAAAGEAQNERDNAENAVENNADGIHNAGIRIENRRVANRAVGQAVTRLGGVALPHTDHGDQHEDEWQDTARKQATDLRGKRQRVADGQNEEQRRVELSRENALGLRTGGIDLLSLLLHGELMTARLAVQRPILQGLLALSAIHKIRSFFKILRLRRTPYAVGIYP